MVKFICILKHIYIVGVNRRVLVCWFFNFQYAFHRPGMCCAWLVVVPPAITTDSVSIVANQRAQLYSGVLVELLFTLLRVIVWHHLRSTRDTLALIIITVHFYVVNPFSFTLDTFVNPNSKFVEKKDVGKWYGCYYNIYWINDGLILKNLFLINMLIAFAIGTKKSVEIKTTIFPIDLFCPGPFIYPVHMEWVFDWSGVPRGNI